MITLVLLSEPENAAAVAATARDAVKAAAALGAAVSACVTNIGVLQYEGALPALLGITLAPRMFNYFDLDICPAMTFSLAVANVSHNAEVVIIVRDHEHAASPAMCALLSSRLPLADKSVFVVAVNSPVSNGKREGA